MQRISAVYKTEQFVSSNVINLKKKISDFLN